MLYYPALISYYIESYKDEYVITDSFYSLLDAACVCDALSSDYKERVFKMILSYFTSQPPLTSSKARMDGWMDRWMDGWMDG